MGTRSLDEPMKSVGSSPWPSHKLATDASRDRLAKAYDGHRAPGAAARRLSYLPLNSAGHRPELRRRAPATSRRVARQLSGNAAHRALLGPVRVSLNRAPGQPWPSAPATSPPSRCPEFHTGTPKLGCASEPLSPSISTGSGCRHALELAAQGIDFPGVIPQLCADCVAPKP